MEKTNPLFEQCLGNVDPETKEEVEQFVAIREATWKLIDCVERYVRQECSRSTLLSRKEFLKRLMENEEDPI